jgi:hypothetical protein
VIDRLVDIESVEGGPGQPDFLFVRSSAHKMTKPLTRKLREAGYRFGWHCVDGPTRVGGWAKIINKTGASNERD